VPNIVLWLCRHHVSNPDPTLAIVLGSHFQDEQMEALQVKEAAEGHTMSGFEPRLSVVGAPALNHIVVVQVVGHAWKHLGSTEEVSQPFLTIGLGPHLCHTQC
jgi:hypothetical protein